jgi:hypothetical protein
MHDPVPVLKAAWKKKVPAFAKAVCVADGLLPAKR